MASKQKRYRSNTSESLGKARKKSKGKKRVLTKLELFDTSQNKCDIWLGEPPLQEDNNILKVCIDKASNTVYKKNDM